MTSGAAVRLGRSGMPAICRSAADLSARGQRRTKWAVRVELLALILAGVAGLGSLRVGPAQLDLLAALAGVLFLVALGSLIWRVLAKPEQAWYGGRAAAESVRTLSWRYAVGGDPFPVNGHQAAAAFLDRLQEILRELSGVGLAATAADDRELTPEMTRVRTAPFTQRRDAYRSDRIVNQIGWYTAKAGAHERAATRWLALAGSASVGGVVAAGLRMFGVIDLDLLGVAGACASAAIAWNQLNQNRNLVSAYRLTARELSIIRDRIDQVDEAGWAVFVSDAEDAISREHTLWLARHGHPDLDSR